LPKKYNSQKQKRYRYRQQLALLMYLDLQELLKPVDLSQSKAYTINELRRQHVHKK